jgi:hypothetical protein
MKVLAFRVIQQESLSTWEYEKLGSMGQVVLVSRDVTTKDRSILFSNPVESQLMAIKNNKQNFEDDDNEEDGNEELNYVGFNR